ncbi:unnamed protein product [Caenorhabditis nigoni]
MQILFVVGIFLTCAQTSSGYNNSEKMSLVGRFNKYRYDVSRNLQIANMHEVRWNKELQQVVEDMDCEKLDHDWWFHNLNLARILEPHRAKHLTCAIPTQTQIACAKRFCQNNYFDSCLCGPKKKIEKSDIIEGEPGTMCPGESINGLGRVPPTTVVPNTTATGTTIRRKKVREEYEYEYEEDSSTSGFAIGVLLNLIIFYLL